MTQFDYSDASNPYSSAAMVADAPAETRVDFIRKTYLHLAGAILAFAGIEFVIFATVDVEGLTKTMLGGQWSWLIVLGLFMVVSWVANAWAQNSTSIAMQYAGLILYVVAEAIIFVPLLFIADKFAGGDVIASAALITLFMFAALTIFVFTTKIDFSFLRGVLMIGMFAAIGVIVASIAIGFSLGMLFTCLMIALACGYILYYTSNVMKHYRVGQHVAASLALFAAVALLFWYVLRLLISLNQD